MLPCRSATDNVLRFSLFLCLIRLIYMKFVADPEFLTLFQGGGVSVLHYN